MAHWLSSSIGLPYEAGGQGPHAFNCWGFVRWALEQHYGFTVPLLPVLETPSQWQRVDCPQEGDVMVLSHSCVSCHVGLWVDVDGGGLAHCLKGAGVVFQNSLALSLLSCSAQRFYRFKATTCLQQ